MTGLAADQGIFTGERLHARLGGGLQVRRTSWCVVEEGKPAKVQPRQSCL
jgi:hypothetical protein